MRVNLFWDIFFALIEVLNYFVFFKTLSCQSANGYRNPGNFRVENFS